MTALADLPEAPMPPEIDLPSDGNITRSKFDALPKPPRGWAWELRDGRLELNHMPVRAWHWKIIIHLLGYWERLGHETLGEQYVADSGFVRGGTGRNNNVADGVVFVEGHVPAPDSGTHDAANIHAVIEAVSDGSEENDASRRFATYAELGIPHRWIVHRDVDAAKIDGMVTMHELIDGGYHVTKRILVSQLTA
jgi:hypothetical protein